MTGAKTGDRQETDTISRLIYGLSTAYHMTGEDRFLKAAETGGEYLREHFQHRDPAEGGYWSHVDPITIEGTSDALGRNRARKNWNSVGDHIPAYLINAWLAVGDPGYADMLTYCAAVIEA